MPIVSSIWRAMLVLLFSVALFAQSSTESVATKPETTATQQPVQLRELPLSACEHFLTIRQHQHTSRERQLIDDPRTSERIDFIGGIRGVAELEKLVSSGKFAVAFSMYPTTVAQLMDIADAGQIMPPKSTWFEPKLRDGLVVYTI